MKFRKNYNQQEAGGSGPAVIEAPKDGDFSTWTIPEGGLTGVDTGEASEVVVPPAVEEVKAKPDEKPEGEKVVPSVVEKPEGEEPVADDDILPALVDHEDDEKEATWEDVATRFELPPVDDANLKGEEKFKAQLNKYAEVKGASEYERGKAETEAIYSKELSPEAMQFQNALNAGMKYEDVIKPANAFYQAAAASDESLLMDYHKIVLKQDDAVAEDSIAVLEANGLAKIEADKIRATLFAKGDQVLQDQVKVYSEKFAVHKADIAKKTERENQELTAELMSRETFLDGKLTKEAKQKLVQRWESGYYKNMMQNDKKAVAEFILWKEYGEAQFKKTKEAATKNAKKETFDKLSNTSKVAGGSQNAAQPTPVGDFSVWGTVRPTGVENS